jgi:hypothetical protein
MWVWALLRTVRVKTQPIWTSVRFRVRANSSADLDRIAQQW